MATRIVTTNDDYDFSGVNTLKELKEEIEVLKLSIATHEKDLATGLKKMPQHLVKSAADSILPAFLTKIISNGTWKLLLSSAAMFANPFSGKFSFKKNILGSAKKLGLMALLKGAYTAWSSKNIAKPKTAAEIKKPNIITSLRTKNFKKH